MAIETLTGLPASLVAGDSLQWTRVIADYSADDGWSVSTHFRTDRGGRLEVEMSGSGTTWTGTLTGAQTAILQPGVISWHVVVSKTTDRVTIANGEIRILPDPMADREPTHAERMLEAIESLIEGRLSRDAAERYTINGQSIDRMTSEDIRKWRDYYRSEVAAQRNRDRQFRGGVSRRIVRTRFV